MLLMGLAVGVDYCLFYLRREREERAAGRDAETALRIAAATSGRAVLVSGLTVMVAMSGMFLSGLLLFKGFAVATILVVCIAMLGSVTVLPALLSLLGDRVERGPAARSGRTRKARGPSGRTGAGRADGSRAVVLRPVLAAPGVFAVLRPVALLVLAAPALGMKTEQLAPGQAAAGRTRRCRAGYRRINEAFPGGPAPARVVRQGRRRRRPGGTPALADFTGRAWTDGQFGKGVSTTLHREAEHRPRSTVPADRRRHRRHVEGGREGAARRDVVPSTLGAGREGRPGLRRAVSWRARWTSTTS